MNKFLVIMENGAALLVDEGNLSEYGSMAIYDKDGKITTKAIYEIGVKSIEQKSNDNQKSNDDMLYEDLKAQGGTKDPITNRFLVKMKNGETHLVNDITEYGKLSQYDEEGNMITKAEYRNDVESIVKRTDIIKTKHHNIMDGIEYDALKDYKPINFDFTTDEVEDRGSTTDEVKGIPTTYEVESSASIDNDVENRLSTAGLTSKPIKYMWEEFYALSRNYYFHVETNVDAETFATLCKKVGRGGYLTDLIILLTKINATISTRYLGYWSEQKQNCITNYSGIFFGKDGKYFAKDWK